MSHVDHAAALELRDVVKHFDGVPALRGASLTVARGTVHGLIGQNGAGKSTLIKILAGIHGADSGTIAIDGIVQTHTASTHAGASGIGFIHQERLLPSTFTVAEALWLGAERTIGPKAAGGFRLLDIRRLQRDTRDALHTHFGVDIAPNRLIGDLSVAEQQIVQITRELIREPRILVFDEPTAALVSREVDRLLQTIDLLRQRGLTILYVSHYLNEIAAICDQVTVLRDGVDVARVDARQTPTEALVSAMIGTQAAQAQTVAPSRMPGNVVLEVRDLGAPGRFENVSFEVRRGEIVGITGLLGSGGKSLVRSLFGLERGVEGEIEIDGKKARLRRPQDAVRRHIAFVPEDRRAHRVAPALSVRENKTLASLARFSRFGRLAQRRETQTVQRLIKELAVRTSSTETPVRHLSGGNQQKIALAKWLSRTSSLYLLDEPTVGVDVGAKTEIYRLLDQLARDGAGVLLFSSDLIELLGITDRVLVMARGRIVRELVSRDADSQDVLAWATGARSAQGSTTQQEIAA